jgi:hypothetical protein
VAIILSMVRQCSIFRVCMHTESMVQRVSTENQVREWLERTQKTLLPSAHSGFDTELHKKLYSPLSMIAMMLPFRSSTGFPLPPSSRLA